MNKSFKTYRNIKQYKSNIPVFLIIIVYLFNYGDKIKKKNTLFPGTNTRRGYSKQQ